MDVELFARKVLKAFIDNPDGFTLQLDGGIPQVGFVVGCKGFEMRLSAGMPQRTVRALVLAYAESVYSGAYRYSGIGGWKDGNWIYFDKVAIYMQRDLAVAAGKRDDQLAIFDLEKGEEIRLADLPDDDS